MCGSRHDPPNATVFEGDWTQKEKTVADNRNYSSLADEFDVAAATETGTADELICNDADNHDDESTVRRRVPTNLADNM